MVKNTFTEAEWREIGATLKRLRNEALELYCKVGSKLPKKHRARKQLQKATDLLSGAKCWLEGEMCKQNPHLLSDPHFVKIFYGPDLSFETKS